jgi:hypothetical protein
MATGNLKTAKVEPPHNVLKKHLSGGAWKRRVFAKKGRKSQTPGKSKGENCRSTPLQRWMAKCSKSYKHIKYGFYCRYWDTQNNRGRAG